MSWRLAAGLLMLPAAALADIDGTLLDCATRGLEPGSDLFGICVKRSLSPDELTNLSDTCFWTMATRPGPPDLSRAFACNANPTVHLRPAPKHLNCTPVRDVFGRLSNIDCQPQ